MSQRNGEFFVIQQTAPASCALCGAVAELRPYGPNGQSICFDCGMANRETTDAAFRALIEGVTTVIVDSGLP